MWYLASGVIGAAAAVGLVVYLWWRHQLGRSKDNGGGELAMQLTDNPLQAHGQKRSPRSSLSGRAAEQRSNAYLAVRVLYQPVRILVGYIQVRSTHKAIRLYSSIRPFPATDVPVCDI